jgi:serine/threonine-protein kinase
MAMEYIQGRTLTSIIESDVLPSIVRRLELIESLCDGLAFAHRRGVVHRDIKPANLMVDEDGRLKIVDFGIARAGADVNLTQAGLLVGTVNYMSPEQVEGRELGGHSDMFAVGAVLYELLSRRQAFPGKNPTTVLNRILNTEPEPLERVCPDLDAAIPPIVARALKKNPAERFADLHEMRLALARVREQLESAPAFDPGESVSMPPPGVITPPPTRRGTDLEELMRRRTQQIEAHLTAAELALTSGRHHDAIARSEEALILDPSNTRAQTIAEEARQRTTSAGAPPATQDRAGEVTR